VLAGARAFQASGSWMPGEVSQVRAKGKAKAKTHQTPKSMPIDSLYSGVMLPGSGPGDRVGGICLNLDNRQL
jgi:hypothetical protein